MERLIPFHFCCSAMQCDGTEERTRIKRMCKGCSTPSTIPYSTCSTIFQSGEAGELFRFVTQYHNDQCASYDVTWALLFLRLYYAKRAGTAQHDHFPSLVPLTKQKLRIYFPFIVTIHHHPHIFCVNFVFSVSLYLLFAFPTLTLTLVQIWRLCFPLFSISKQFLLSYLFYNDKMRLYDWKKW